MMGSYLTRSADGPSCWATSGEATAEAGRGFVAALTLDALCAILMTSSMSKSPKMAFPRDYRDRYENRCSP